MRALRRHARRTPACRSTRASPRACARRGPTCRCRETTTRPRQSRISSTASTKRRPGAPPAPRSRCASVASTSRASASARAASTRRVRRAASRRSASDGGLRVHAAKYNRARRCASTRRACARSRSRRVPSPSRIDRRCRTRLLPLILVLLARSRRRRRRLPARALPPMLGYLLVGIARRTARARAGSRTTPTTRHLAEFGIVFLMFSIGLEFSLPQLRAMRRAVFGLGLAQVAITTVARAGRAALRRASAGRRASCSAARSR